MDRRAMNDRLRDRRREIDPTTEGREMHALIASLYPICRSLTGPGVRETLAVLKRQIPLDIREVPTGTRVLDWTVPREWTIRDAYIKNAAGERVVDFRRSNLHVVGYSVPVHRRLSLAELRPHLHSLPEHPDWIPYRTSYYDEDWGFCLAHRLAGIAAGGRIRGADRRLARGRAPHVRRISCPRARARMRCSSRRHLCHPSLCNDNLSGVAVATALARLLVRIAGSGIPTASCSCRRHWDRSPGSRSTRRPPRASSTVSCSRASATAARSTYKRSRRGDAPIDRAVGHVLRHAGAADRVEPFSPWGYDERQYCSPGFNLPVGCLMRTPHGRFPEYHTSADDLDFVRPGRAGGHARRCACGRSTSSRATRPTAT